MKRRRHLLVALTAAAMLCGATAAAGIALAIPHERDERPQRAADPLALAAAAPQSRAAEPTEGPPFELPQDSNGPTVVGEPQIEARAPDPRGGPPWAVRVAVLKAGRDELLCAQLGREWRGRFGWIDPADRFRELPFVTLRGILCSRVGAHTRFTPQVDVVSSVGDPATARMRVVQSVVWGITGAGTRAGLKVDGRAAGVPATPHGIVLAPLDEDDPGARRPDVRATVRPAGGGKPVVLHDSFHGDGLSVAADAATPEGYTRRQWVTVPRPGEPPTSEYRTPDPAAGGSPWGVVAARARDGGWCVSQLGRVAGGRVGHVDRELGIFVDSVPGWGSGCGSPAGRPTRGRPVSVSWTGTSPGESDRSDDERRARRLQPGRMMFSGIVHPDVVAVTVATPRDVRTLRPSRRAHAIAAVYDGMFQPTRVRFSVRFSDGTVLADAGPF